MLCYWDQSQAFMISRAGISNLPLNLCVSHSSCRVVILSPLIMTSGAQSSQPVSWGLCHDNKWKGPRLQPLFFFHWRLIALQRCVGCCCVCTPAPPLQVLAERWVSSRALQQPPTSCLCYSWESSSTLLPQLTPTLSSRAVSTAPVSQRRGQEFWSVWSKLPDSLSPFS